jgi:15-cis-phytoene synthase
MSDALDIINDSTRKIVKKSKTNFMYSTIFLNSEKQEALQTIYSFCRHSDDIVDDEHSDLESRKLNLENWRSELEKAFESDSKIHLLNDLKNVVDRFSISHDLFFDLLKGMEIDLVKTRYNNLEDLKQYCYYAASTVGLMTIEVFGYKDNAIREYAVNLGIALQLTNILRDVKKDAMKGRIYLPLDDMSKYGYSEKDIIDSNYNSNFVNLMKYETEVAKSFYKKADSYLCKSEKGRMLSARIMEHIYFRLLKRIERYKYDVYNNYIRISKLKKLFLAYGIFLKYKLLYKF